MKKQIKNLCGMVIMAFFVCWICSTFSYALIKFNWRECANEPNCIAETSTLTLTLKTSVIESAGYFLNSHSDYQAFLNCVEMSELKGIDYNMLREILYSAIENMEKAKMCYSNIKATSEKIPYNQAVIDKLIKFDYDGFQVQHGLIEPIFQKVKAFLGKGDIAGLDNIALANLDTILKKLYEIKAAVDKNQFPEIALLWRINQLYAEDHLFGQYVSEVFKAILF